MTHEDAGHYAAKHTGAPPPDKTVLAAVEAKTSNDTISCMKAHKISEEMNISPREVGKAIDFCEARIAKCQLGLFGYSPNKSIITGLDHVSEEMERLIRKYCSDKKLPCKKAWDIARTMGCKKIDVANACETLEIKIAQCQLGAF